MACCNAHISIWAVNVLDGLHLKLFADVRQAFLLSASIYCGDAQLMISMLSRYQLSEVDLLCATCTLIFFLKQGCISQHCGQLNNIEINFKRLHLVTFMSYIQPIA